MAAHGFGPQVAANPPHVPLEHVACAAPVYPAVLVEIEGVEPLVVDGKLKEQAPCVSTEAAHAEAPMAGMVGCVQRAMPLLI